MTLTENYNGLEIEIDCKGKYYEVEYIWSSTFNAEIEILNADIEVTEKVDEKLIYEYGMKGERDFGIDLEYWLSLDYKEKRRLINEIFFNVKNLLEKCNFYLSDRQSEYEQSHQDYLEDLDVRTAMEKDY